jgi:WhiB family redox-sensing transcriptional regulator
MKRPPVIALALSGQLDQIFNTVESPNFGSSAACSGLDTEIFYPNTAAELSAAKAICADCPVIAMCAKWGVERVNDGVLGGLSEKERFLLRGGKRALDVDEVAELQSQYNFITRQPASVVASEFGADVRSVVRWRGILRQSGKAA